MKKVIRTFTNDTGIDQHVYDRSEELVHVPVGHIFEEFEDGSYVTRPIGAIRRFFDGGGGGVGEEIRQTEAGTEAKVPVKEPDLETKFRTAATFGLADEEEGDEKTDKEPPVEEKTYKRSVRELMPLIKAAESLDDLADLKEPKEDRKTIIRALLAKRKELLMAGGRGESARWRKQRLS